jgi:SAM-dependent methyltransferase
LNLNRLREILNFNLNNRKKWVEKNAGRVPARSKILDIGAGTGRYRQFFAHCDYKTHDFTKTPDLNGKYTHIDYISDICSIPVKNEEFDYLICTEVIEHVPEPIKAVNEMARIAKKGALLFLTAPLASFLHQEPYHYYGGFTPFWYEKILEEAGFSIITIERNGGFFSLFGQESRRFSNLLTPTNTIKKGIIAFLISTSLWLFLFPIVNYIIPLMSAYLDRLGLEKIATVGYHIVAQKRNS